MNLRPIIGAAAAALILAVAGCAAAAGSQSSYLLEDLHRYAPSGFKEGWKEYLGKPFPERLALSRDGTSIGFAWCPAPTRCSNSGSASYDAISSCESNGRGECSIYAQGRRVVWPHNFPWPVLPASLREYRSSIGQTADGKDRATLQ